MRKAIRRVAVVFAVALVGIQFVGPARTNPHTEPSETLAATGRLTSDAAAVLDRSCRDCHSNETRWPWYSNVAPMSWLVINHVNHGRSHFNYSKWATYDSEDTRGFLVDMCALARERDMPLPSYLWIHRGARPSDRDIAVLCEWTELMRRH